MHKHIYIYICIYREREREMLMYLGPGDLGPPPLRGARRERAPASSYYVVPVFVG